MQKTTGLSVMVVGGGGREHALVKALAKSPEIGLLFCLPGNGGIAQDAICVPIAAKDIAGLVAFATENSIDFAVVAPDDPLVLGAVDALAAAGVPCFGPDKKAAEIEGSKVFSKGLMQKYGIPTAQYATFSDLPAALAYIRRQPLPLVIKADGLALGKGVIIAHTAEEAEEAARQMLEGGRFGQSGRQVVIEQFLTGPEVTVLTFTDGKTLVPMVSSMDHKRAREGDKGLNTGGMGAIAPNPYYTEEIARRCMAEIFLPTVAALASEGRPFKGCLYFGLMLTPQGPKVIEYNCRFGDPEAQAVLSLLDSDLFSILRATAEGRLAEAEVRFKSGAACCVVVASEGYPESYETGFPISFEAGMDAEVFIAGAKQQGGRLITGGGRVLGVTATGDTLAAAVEKAYQNVQKVHFQNAYFRRDIGKTALEAK